MTISLASRESQAGPMTEPDSTPASRRTPGPDGGANSVTVPGGRQEVAARVLAVDPELDGVAADLGVVVAELLAVRDPEHLADQVDPGDLLGDRVLHLQTGVDLQEGDQPVLGDQELAGAGADVARLAQDRLGGPVQLRVLLVREERRGRLLYQLLVAALERAVTGRDDHHVAVLVGQALGLDVPRVVQVLLDEALATAEGGDRLADRRLVQLGDLLQRAGHLQTATATAEGRLDGDRQTVLAREGDHLVGARDRVRGAGHQRGAGALRDVTGRHLVAQVADGLRRRADPDQPGVDHGLRELGVLRQEAVAGVDRVRARVGRRLEHLGDVQVAGGRGVAAEGVRLVGRADVQGVPVRLGVDGDAGDTGVRAGPGDSDGDFAAVGDEHLAHVWLPS
ncbi:hypothetical protein GCM10020229_66970 [Kitasatospora albolonga]